jgi:hypothetical protein
MSYPALPKKVKLQYFFDRSHYVVGPEETVAVSVCLQETFNPSISSAFLAPGMDGLIQGGTVVEVSSPLPTCPALVRTTSAIAGNSDFDFAVISLFPVQRSTKSAGVLEMSDKPVFGEVVSRNAHSETVLLPLATFTFTAGKVPGEVTFLTAMTPEALSVTPGEINITDDGIALDDYIEVGTAMITVAPKSKGAHAADRFAEIVNAASERYRPARGTH